jgi:hypothetical protein
MEFMIVPLLLLLMGAVVVLAVEKADNATDHNTNEIFLFKCYLLRIDDYRRTVPNAFPTPIAVKARVWREVYGEEAE